MNVAIIDYGMGNLGSVRRAFEECHANVLVITQPEELKMVDRIVLPGVGAFADAMSNLQSAGWIDALKECVQERRIPLLGICLGMQVLADKGFEGGEVDGLGLIRGQVRKLSAEPQSLRIPHIGWNEINIVRSSPLIENIESGTDFYFVHSYHFIPNSNDHIVALTPYGGRFASIVSDGIVFGVQFHPEKSSRPGFALMKNFLNQSIN